MLMGVGQVTANRDSAAMRRIIDDVLSCDSMVRCGDRLECTWLASQLADSLRRS
ncbi:MAG: hypothetical protein AB7G62_10580 [Magnetospirillum sp.]